MANDWIALDSGGTNCIYIYIDLPLQSEKKILSLNGNKIKTIPGNKLVCKF